MCHLSTEFCENRLGSFCAILPTTTDKQTNKLTNTDENITSLNGINDENRRWVLIAVRLTIVYSDYRYLIARQCFDYSNSISATRPRPSCSVEKSSLVMYSKSSSSLPANVVVDLLTVADLPSACANRLHFPRRDEGCSLQL